MRPLPLLLPLAVCVARLNCACGADATASAPKRDSMEPSDGEAPTAGTTHGDAAAGPERNTSNEADAASAAMATPVRPVSPEPASDAGPARTDAGRASSRDAAVSAPSRDAGTEPRDGTGSLDAATEPKTLPELLMGIWTLDTSVDGECEQESYWWFHSMPRIEHITVATNCSEPGRVQTTDTGEYSLDERTLNVGFADRRERVMIAHGLVDDERVLHLKAFVATSEVTYETVHAVEGLAADGSTDLRSELTAELAFDQPIPIDGEGDCMVAASYRLVTYQRYDASGNELPDAERETVTSDATEVLPCAYGPSGLGQEIRVAARFFDARPPPDAAATVLQDVMWFDPEQPDALFMENWVVRYDVLPQGL